MPFAFVKMSGPSRVISVAVFYFLCSISMNFLNKAVVSTYNFNYPFTIMSCQMIVTILFLDTLRLSGVLKLQPYSVEVGGDFLAASISFAIHSTLSLIALHGMNIPMYGAIKRCTPLVNLILSVTVLKRPLPSPLLSTAVGMITVGVLIASLGDLQFDAHAYTMGALSVFAQAGYLTLVQKSSETNKRGTIEMLHVNSYNTLPVFLVMALILGEPTQVSISLATEEASFYYVFAFLIMSGCILTYSQFLCAAVCSALTTSMVGVSKSVLQTILGFFTFGGVKFHPLNVIGLVLNVFGGMVYTYVKHVESTRERRASWDGRRNRTNSVMQEEENLTKNHIV